MNGDRIEKWKNVLNSLREEYGEEWKKNSEKVITVLKEIKEVINSTAEITETEIERIFEFIGNLPKDFERLFWIWGSVKATKSDLQKLLNNATFKTLLNTVDGLKSSEDVLEIKELVKKAMGIPHAKITTISSLDGNF